MLTKVFVLWVVLQTGSSQSAQTQMSSAVYHTSEACERAGMALQGKFNASYICTESR